MRLPLWLALKAEALHLAYRTSEALEVIREAVGLGERSEERWWHAELYRLRGVFLAALGADENQIEASFCAAIEIAREQKSVSLEKRAGRTYAEYRAQKNGSVARQKLPTASLQTSCSSLAAWWRVNARVSGPGDGIAETSPAAIVTA